MTGAAVTGSTASGPLRRGPATEPMVVRTRAELAAARSRLTGPVAVVMTMGALHEGHAALIRAARQRTDAVVVSVFVNPLQFGAGEDLARYPRSLAADLALCRREGAQLVFVPDSAVVYPKPPTITVRAGRLGGVLEGASRPGHFDGVLTVVAKLLHLTAPTYAVFGDKDAQQLALIRAMVADLDFGVQVVGVPTVRDPDGLALSSRNRYLSPPQRTAALAICRALRVADVAAAEGAEGVRRRAAAALAGEPALRPDYLALVDPASFAEVGTGHTGQALLAIAAWVGTTRLIDNVSLHISAGPLSGTYSREP